MRTIFLLMALNVFLYNTTSAQNERGEDLLKNGKLVIVGGAMKDTAIFNQFIRLAGGQDANFVMVPTAGADTISDEMLEQYRSFMTSRGFNNVTVLHTKDRELANDPDFYEPVDNADGVWFSGGRQWRIADSYLGTETQLAFERVLERGGVIGGSSAGATIQGEYLARGDTKTNTIMMGDHEIGFSYLPGTTIDQHLLKRNRQFDLIEIIEARPDLLGIGIDEDTAIIVEGDEFYVMGSGYVAIYNHKDWENDSFQNNGKFFLMSPGDRYNWKLRKMIEWNGRGRDIPSVSKQN